MILDYQGNNAKDQVLLEEMKKDTEFLVHTWKVPEAIQNIVKVQDVLNLQKVGTFPENQGKIFQYLQERTKILVCSFQIEKVSEILGQMVDTVENFAQTEKCSEGFGMKQDVS